MGTRSVVCFRLPRFNRRLYFSYWRVQRLKLTALCSRLKLKLAHRRLCPVGYSGSTSGAVKCEPCPRGTFSSEDGLEPCKSCPPGSDARPGSSACVECSWFTYECDGFWEDVAAAVSIGAALLRLTFLKLRRLCAGDQAQQQRDESVALLTAVRAHGRTLDGAQYAPMVRFALDLVMFGWRD
jgi:hypothetical protein